MVGRKDVFERSKECVNIGEVWQDRRNWASKFKSANTWLCREFTDSWKLGVGKIYRISIYKSSNNSKVFSNKFLNTLLVGEFCDRVYKLAKSYRHENRDPISPNCAIKLEKKNVILLSLMKLIRWFNLRILSWYTIKFKSELHSWRHIETVVSIINGYLEGMQK